MHPITTTIIGALALVPLAASCDTDRPAPQPCVQTIAEGWTPAFDRWQAAHGPLDYRADGFWYDARGEVIGSAAEEDAPICVFVP